MRAKKFMTVLVMSAAIASAGCDLAAAEKMDGYTKITAQEVMKMIEDGRAPAVVADVRSVKEYNGGRVPGAIVIQHNVVKDKLTEILPDRNTTLLVYCRSGNRVVSACKDLVAVGYVNVCNFGGVIDWPYTVAK